ncbi:MAG TPA: terminase TerL endonuclease subunit [Steroidobacteraceae bacterium]|nr:terminase TerL endonuclease subunit [Steroidobacteraceae bacterium]
MTRATASPHVEAAIGYAKAVTAGGIPAGRYVIAACRRFASDLERSKRGWRFRLDRKAAERVCRFVELLPHVKGMWALPRPGQSNQIALEPWQCFLLVNVFGWKRTDGTRRFRECYLEVPRKNGKSLIAAAIGLYMLTSDGEPGAEVYSGATTEKQAWEVFRPARLMALARPDLVTHFALEVNASNISIPSTGAKFEPLIGKPGDGASPSCAIIDEYHEHADPAQYDTMLTGMGARRQPLMLIITTAGDNLGGPCYDKRTSLTRILEGAVEDDEKFGIIYSIDEADDWTAEAALIKANPNYGVSVGAEFLQSRQREGMQNSRRAGVFKTKHLNVWLQARHAYFNLDRWAECARAGLTLESLKGRSCRIVLDLASKVDIAAMQFLFELDGGRYATLGRYYLPEEAVQKAANDHYRGWAADGHLVVTDGEIIDFERIKDDIAGFARDFQLLEVAYDPWQATQLATELQRAGIAVVEYRQTVQTMSEPMKTLDAWITARKLEHDGNPVMTWMMSNVVANEDAKDNVYPRKLRNEDKIDGAVALIMSIGRELAAGAAPKAQESVYEQRFREGKPLLLVL